MRKNLREAIERHLANCPVCHGTGTVTPSTYSGDTFIDHPPRPCDNCSELREAFAKEG